MAAIVPGAHGAHWLHSCRSAAVLTAVNQPGGLLHLLHSASNKASATRLSAAPRWERLRDHGHGRRPSPTQTAPRGGRSRDYLVGGGRSASHVPYPDLAGRHRGQAAIGATGVTGAALNSLFYRSRVQPGTVTAEASWLHRARVLKFQSYSMHMHTGPETIILILAPTSDTLNQLPACIYNVSHAPPAR